jgi:hypothetical protein
MQTNYQRTVKIEIEQFAKRDSDENEKFLKNDEPSVDVNKILSINKENNQSLTKVERQCDDDSQTEERMQWSSFWEYFLSIIGFVIDLGI